MPNNTRGTRAMHLVVRQRYTHTRRLVDLVDMMWITSDHLVQEIQYM